MQSIYSPGDSPLHQLHPLTKLAVAGLILAATYDPGALEKVAIYGVVADITMARSWYEKAKEFGSAEAPRRLELLAGRMR